MTAAYTFVGTTDEVTTCGCCGRSDLKGTVVLRPADGGDFVFFGSVCGAKAQGWTVKDFNTAAKNADKQRRQAIQTAINTHPLEAQINREIKECNAVVPRMSFEQRRPHMLRWSELRRQIHEEVAAQFDTTVERIRAGKY